MKLFCECNSEWVIWWHDKTNRLVTGAGTSRKVSFGLCRMCDFFFWIDADYENMMHDLKAMNS